MSVKSSAWSHITLAVTANRIIVSYLLKAKTVKPEKQPLLCSASTQQQIIVTIPDVTRTAVDMDQLGKHVSSENSRNNKSAVFLCGQCLGVIKKSRKIV
jgi:hypothetical protein